MLAIHQRVLILALPSLVEPSCLPCAVERAVRAVQGKGVCATPAYYTFSPDEGRHPPVHIQMVSDDPKLLDLAAVAASEAAQALLPELLCTTVSGSDIGNRQSNQTGRDPWNW